MRKAAPFHRHGDGELRAVLGPTNTGKTSLAVTRMLGRDTGVMGLPLRLLAREVYDRIVREKGRKFAALVTGEEKIVPTHARWFACTVESMPAARKDQPFDFVGIDEAQLAADPERGHVFTDRLLHFRGAQETLVLGSDRLQPYMNKLGGRPLVEPRERFSPLTHLGHMRLSALPKRSAVIAFSVDQVYALAETLRRLKGGVAIVMGALSPQTRNAQAAMFQRGEVDYLVATDAIGMGLNMDIDHVALAETRKFDGRVMRELFPHELAQIAGRAGRGPKPGSFGTTGNARPLDEHVAAQIEQNEFEPMSTMYWRNSDLVFNTPKALFNALEMPSPGAGFTRVSRRLDELVLRDLVVQFEDAAQTPAGLRRLWEVAQVPDFRKHGVDPHMRLMRDIAGHLLGDGQLPEDWFAARLHALRSTRGGVDALASRLQQARTWGYCAHRRGWLGREQYWQEQCAEAEARLSDALHEGLIARFVDKRTSTLLKLTRSGLEAQVELAENGGVHVEGHEIGRLFGFVFQPKPGIADGAERKLRQAARPALRRKIRSNMQAFLDSQPNAVTLAEDGTLQYENAPIAKLAAGADWLHPKLDVLVERDGVADMADKVQEKLDAWLQAEMAERLKPLIALETKLAEEGLDPAIKGLGFRLIENHGAMQRRPLAKELSGLSQDQRKLLRECGVRFGEFSLFMPWLLKPGSARMLAIFVAVHNGDGKTPWLAPPGLTSFDAPEGVDDAALAMAGFRRLGKRVIRLDMLERLGQEIRSAREKGEKGAFSPTLEMVALLGCTKPDLEDALSGLGYKRVEIGKTEDGEVDELQSLWRYVPVKHGKGPHKPARPQTPHKGKGKPAQRTQKKKAQPRQIDPDSPFAVLKDLNLKK